MKFNRVFEISLRYCDVKNFKALVARAIITDRDFLVWVTFMWKIILFTSGELSNLELLYEYSFWLFRYGIIEKN